MITRMETHPICQVMVSKDGTRHNGAAFQTGAVGQGLYFDGSNDYFTLPIFPMGGEFSISLWAKLTNSKIGTA